MISIDIDPFDFFRILYLLAIIMSGTANAQVDDVMEAAVRLKQVHVERSWKECITRVANENRCKKLLQLNHKREKKVLARIALAISDADVNIDQLNKEMVACYSPNSNYTHLIDCWERLADRLDAARDGKFLLKR